MSKPKTTLRWTIDDARQMAPAAFKEALSRYPTDTEGALIFFGHAIGLGIGEPTVDDIAWAQEVMASYGR